MSFPVAVLVAGSLSSVFAVGGVLALLSHSQQQRRKWASQTWRDLTLRNGVTEQSPFHSRESSFNAPGLVEVFPRSHRPTSPAQPPASANLCNARPQLTSAKPSAPPPVVSPSASPPAERPALPLELSDPPHPSERTLVRQSYSQGNSQTKVIKEVWGLSKGGSRKYNKARSRFREYVRDIARPDLLYYIRLEEDKANAE